MTDSDAKYTITGGSGDNTLKAGKKDSVLKGKAGDDTSLEMQELMI